MADPRGHNAASTDPAEEIAAREVKEALETGAVRESPELPEHLRYLPERGEAQDQKLKELYARGILAILGGQLVIADVVFIVFAWAGKHWNVPNAVIQTWLGATVVQLVGVVTVVTRYLFPNRDRKEDR